MDDAEVAEEIFQFLLERFGDDGLPMDVVMQALATVLASLACHSMPVDVAMARCAALFQPSSLH